VADRDWLQEAKATLRDRTGSAMEVYGSEMCVVLAGLAVDRPDIRDAAAFADLVAATESAEIVRAIVADDLRDPERRARTEAALEGDQAAIDALLAGMADHYPADKLAR